MVDIASLIFCISRHYEGEEMGHYAKVLDGKVVQVIVAEADFFDTFDDDSAATWVQTSYNTHENTHLLGGTPLRGNYAGIGYIYDETNDVFYPPQPHASWTLNTSKWAWEPPIPRPDDEDPAADPPIIYEWDESAYQADNTAGWVQYST